MRWYNELGFKHNPLSIRPTQESNLIGYEKILQRIIYQLKIGNVIFLEGSFGTGKSSILKYIRRKFKKNIVYFNYAQKSNLKKKIMDTRNTFRKMLFMKPKEILVLVDEANLADKKDFDFLYEFYIMDRVKSIVFAGTDFKTVPFNKAFKADTKLYKLNEIKQNLAIEIVKVRMPETQIISPLLAKRIFASSDNNPRRYLENLEDIIRTVIHNGRKKVTKKDVNEFFSK